DVQEKQLDHEINLPSLERYPAPLPLQAPEEGFEKTIRWLLEAKRPVILADWVGRREAGFLALGQLAELLAAPVLDQCGRFNFPVQHPLNRTGRSRSRRRDHAQSTGARQSPPSTVDARRGKNYQCWAR